MPWTYVCKKMELVNWCHDSVFIATFLPETDIIAEKKCKNILFLNLRSHGGAKKLNMSNNKRGIFFFKRQL